MYERNNRLRCGTNRRSTGSITVSIAVSTPGGTRRRPKSRRDLTVGGNDSANVGARSLQARRIAGVRLLLERGDVVEAAEGGHPGVVGRVERRVALERRLAAGDGLEDGLVDDHLVVGDVGREVIEQELLGGGDGVEHRGGIAIGEEALEAGAVARRAILAGPGDQAAPR